MRRKSSTSIPHVPLIIFSLLSLFSLVSAQTSIKKICKTKQCLSAAQNLKESINFEANPCDDFYKYACGNWPNVHKNPNSVPGDTFQLRYDETMAELYDFLRQNNSKEEPEAVHKTRQFYALCLNKAHKVQPVKTILQKIGLPVLPSPYDEIENYDYTAALAKAAKLAGIKMFFDLTTGSNPYNRRVNMITLRGVILTSEIDPNVMPLTSKSARSKRAAENISQDQFMAQVMSTMCEESTSISCTQWNSPGNTARKIMIEKILNQSNEIAQISGKSTSAFDSSLVPVIYTLKQLQDLTDRIAIEVNTTIPKLNWTRYIEETYTGLDNVTLDLSDSTKVQIAIERLDYIEEKIRFIYKRQNVKLLELGLWWRVVSHLLLYADSRIFETRNKMGNFGDTPTREQRCAEITKLTFGMAVSYAYATKAKYTEAKIDIHEMFNQIQKSLKRIIEEVPWMDETTRQRALKKLHSVKSYIVYPSSIKTTKKLNDFYHDVEISDDFCDTMIKKIQNQVKKTLSKLNQINDLSEDDWSFAPSTVNGYYKLETNTMIIPAGIVGLSIYNNSLRALDYGGLGSIIGHELTHAFDNIGRCYNEIGNLEDWWQPETLNLYREKAECFVKAYGNYSINFAGVTLKGDSKVTLAEDISDNGGFRESLLAYKKFTSEFGEERMLPQFENFTNEQLLTIAFANVWCENPTTISLSIAESNEHSPNGVRVNGVLQNSKEFADIWKCPKGSQMNPNIDKCSIW